MQHHVGGAPHSAQVNAIHNELTEKKSDLCKVITVKLTNEISAIIDSTTKPKWATGTDTDADFTVVAFGANSTSSFSSSNTGKTPLTNTPCIYPSTQKRIDQIQSLLLLSERSLGKAVKEDLLKESVPEATSLYHDIENTEARLQLQAASLEYQEQCNAQRIRNKEKSVSGQNQFKVEPRLAVQTVPETEHDTEDTVVAISKSKSKYTVNLVCMHIQ